MADHAIFSASAAHRWAPCPGSLVLAAGRSSPPSVYSAQGTVAHTVLERYLRERIAPQHLLGQTLTQDGFEIEVDDDMVSAVVTAIDNINDMTQGYDLRLPESRVNYSTWLGVDRDTAWGTADVIAIVGDELQVHDYKHGMGEKVDAVDNPQMLLYAAGALTAYGELAAIARVRMVIHQPRVSRAPSEWVITLEELEQEVSWLRTAAGVAVEAMVTQGARDWEHVNLAPGEKQCRWCPAKAQCPALRDAVLETALGSAPATVDEFDAVMDTRQVNEASLADTSDDWLAASMRQADLIEDWVRAIRAEVERRLLAGAPVPGFKLVAGKRGNRAWTDAAAVEDYLRKTARLPVEKVYDMKLISPTSAEKLLKAGDLGDRQWTRLTELITQTQGKPSVAPESDKRPALEVQPVVNDFDLN